MDQWLAQGRFTAELRPRYNRIDESNKPERTEVGTLRAIGGWRSAPLAGMRLTAEGIYTDVYGSSVNTSGAANATSEYPLLPDPRFHGVNQVFVDYSGIDALRVRAGRQIVRMDNQRWVSDNDFRQIPQLFDGVLASYTGIGATELTGGYFWRQRTTSGTEDELKLGILHAAWNPLPGHSLAGYAYFHDEPQNGAFTSFANNSYRAIGVRASGTAAQVGAFEIPYELEYAHQDHYAGGNPLINVSYWRAGTGIANEHLTLRGDYEVKGSNGGHYGLQMPLTDFYSFNGWTLHFFNTPPRGLRDGWLTLRYEWEPLTFYAEAHRFRSDYGSIDFGRELDVGLTYEWNQNLFLRMQHARYDPSSDTADPSIRKTWITLTWRY